MIDPYDDTLYEAFKAWYASEGTERRFHCGQFSDREIAFAAMVWMADYLNAREAAHVV